jgi:hypothetical protein
MARHRAAGDAGLTAKPSPGWLRFLTPEQDRRVRCWLAQKPTAGGAEAGSPVLLAESWDGVLAY